MAERWRPLACLLHGVHNAAATGLRTPLQLQKQGWAQADAYCNYGAALADQYLTISVTTWRASSTATIPSAANACTACRTSIG